MADNIQATPRNYLGGLLSDAYKWMQSPERTQQMQGFAGLLGTTGVPQTIERMAYGEPLTNIGRANVPLLKPETADALMTVGGLSPEIKAAAKMLPKNLPVGMSIKPVDDLTGLLSYRGTHTAPSPEYGAPLYDLTGGGQMYPADVYSSKAAQYYGTGYPKADKEAFALANKVRGNPDAEVTMYRAVPKDEKITNINAGDWVTLSKDYAKNHGESVLGNDYKILSQKVKAKDLWTNADSIHEFGYQPQTTQKPSFTYPQEEAMRLAQQRAALPVEQGGLGLLANNTAAERAAAMGFDTDVLHGTSSDINKVVVLPEGRRYAQPFYTTADTSKDAAEFASQFANTKSEMGAPRVMPLMMRGSVMDTRNNPAALKKLQDIAEQSYTELKIGEKGLPTWGQVNNYATEARNSGIDAILLDERTNLNSIANLNPDNLRSRFAAFDPFRRTAATAAAMGVAAPDLLAQEQPIITQQQIDDELAKYGLLGR